MSGHVEDSPVPGAQIEDRRAPLDVVVRSEHAHPGMCKSSVDGQPVGQSGIELRRQAGGCGIGDLELHSDDRRQALTDQTLRDTREGVGGRLPTACARRAATTSRYT